ncbi:tyrosine-protein phosphatase [Rhodococcus sp. NCIMB 12038]|uniref:tyrosine-protein phosphatase n=1 Tax=Rhodococcus sp. NCIMB 12038 TaxID=933800 RepID=UPI00211B259D|nr:tyrosine-protein phosphatase [Rhodococcus sp. NCIMB 12038]
MTASYGGLLGFRDVGGLRTRDGGRVRTGVLFRSGTPQFLDEQSARALIADTGIRATIDLRLPHEVAVEGRGPLDELGVRHFPHPFSIGDRVAEDSAVAPMDGDDPLVTRYLKYLAEDAAGVVSPTIRLLEPAVLPVLVHCIVGKDRTGVAVALLLDAIGVLREDIAADYAAAPDDVAASMRRLRQMASYGSAADLYPPEAWTAPADAIKRFLGDVDQQYGGTLNLLQGNGIGPDEIRRLTELLITYDDATKKEYRMRVTETCVIRTTPDAVWKVGGDTANVADWIPALEKSHQHGDLRYATFANGGGEATERIVHHDDPQRSYTYEYVSGPLPLSFYSSTFTVNDHPEGAEVVWSAEFASTSPESEPELAEAITDIYRSALVELANRTQ